MKVLSNFKLDEPALKGFLDELQKSQIIPYDIFSPPESPSFLTTFLSAFLEFVKDEIPGSTDYFDGEIQEIFKGVKPNDKYQNEEITSFQFISFSLHHVKSLEQFLQEFIKEKLISADKYQTAEGKNIEVNVTSKVQRIPPILILYSQRIVLDSKTKTRKKFASTFTFPFQFDVSPYMVYTNGPKIYDLIAIINLPSDFSKGVYSLYVRISENQWTKITDNDVSQVQFDSCDQFSKNTLFFVYQIKLPSQIKFDPSEELVTRSISNLKETSETSDVEVLRTILEQNPKYSPLILKETLYFYQTHVSDHNVKFILEIQKLYYEALKHASNDEQILFLTEVINLMEVVGFVKYTENFNLLLKFLFQQFKEVKLFPKELFIKFLDFIFIQIAIQDTQYIKLLDFSVISYAASAYFNYTKYLSSSKDFKFTYLPDVFVGQSITLPFLSTFHNPSEIFDALTSLFSSQPKLFLFVLSSISKYDLSLFYYLSLHNSSFIQSITKEFYNFFGK